MRARGTTRLAAATFERSRAIEALANEMQNLHYSARDLVALTALAASWSGYEPRAVAESLGEVLGRTLGLDLVYVCVKGVPAEVAFEGVSAMGQPGVAGQAEAIDSALAPWLKSINASLPPSIPNPVGSGTVRLAVIPIGEEGVHGVVAAGSQRADFPTESERLLLNLGANQVAIWLREARLVAALHEANQLKDDVLTREQAARTELAEWKDRYEAAIQATGQLLYDRNAQMQLAAIVESSGDAILSHTLDGIILSWNTGAERLYGYTAGEIIGQHISLLTPPEQLEEMPRLLERLRQGERVEYVETLRQKKDGTHLTVSLTISPVKNADRQIIGASAIARDITARKQAEEALREQARLATFSTEVGFALTQEATLRNMLQRCTDAMIHHLGAAYARVWTLNQDENVLELQASAGLDTHLDGPHSRLPIGQCTIGRIVQERKPYLTNTALGDPSVPEQDRTAREGLMAFAGYPLVVEERVVGVAVLFAHQPLTDPTLQALAAVANVIALGVKRKHIEAQLQEEVRIVETLYRVGTMLTAELDLQKLLQTITDETTALTGAQFGAFFYNDVNSQGEAYLLYTLSGAPREAFARFPMPRNTTLFEATFRGKEVIRLDDVTRDPRYGQNPPYYGMPPGHLSVRSYLAAPVVLRSGVVLGGLFFGHSKPGVFNVRDERIMAGVAAQAAVALDNARLYQKTQEAKETLLRQATELQRSNAELEQFAYIASHDLQEPLRMVTTFMQILAKRYQGKLDAKADEFIGFAVDGAQRMQQLIHDLLIYSRVGKQEQAFGPIDCEAVLARTLIVLKMRIEESRAQVTHDSLPTLLADAGQLEQLFQNLIGNALKFHGPEPPRVHVSARQEGQYWVFAVQDNGIGIDPQHGERIFQIFQRLHTRRTYPGTGIGLAICRKIVERHKGRIWMESELGKGATFFFTLPAI